MTGPANTVRDTRTPAIVAALVESGALSADRRDLALEVVDRVLGGQAAPASPPRRRLAELAGYVGAAFVFSAAALFLGSQWESLSTGGRVGLLAGVAVVLVVAATTLLATAAGGPAAVRRGPDPVRRRLAGALLTGAAASASAALGVLVDAETGRSDAAALTLAFAALALLSLAGYLAAPTLLGQLAVATGVVAAVLFLFDELDGIPAAVVGLVLVGVGVAWLAASERGLWREAAAGRVLGCGLALVGAQVPALAGEARWFGYLTLAIVAAAAFGVYVARPAWPYLAAGVVGVTLVVPEALADWTDDTLGPAGVMLVTGVTLLAASLLGFRLRRDAEGARERAGHP